MFGNKYLKVSFFLFLSGMCALIYEIVWMREFRLIFGATTQASATVLALFMGGIGLGSFFLGKKADLSKNPLAMYGWLELGIAGYAVVTPFIITSIRSWYWSLGGILTLGAGMAMVVRLLLSAIILAIPTFLMGGTLPAAVRSLQEDTDVRRRGLALLYSANTLGAVLGAGITTFFLLQYFGAKKTLWLAGEINIVVAITALFMSRKADVVTKSKKMKLKKNEKVRENKIFDSKALIYVAAAVIGFVFFLMELVWYRMLGPLLGGSTYTFGLILAVTLLGIGIGGLLYSIIGSKKRATLNTFAITCSMEALFLIAPFAAGDNIAILTGFAMPISEAGIFGKILAWSFIAGIVILPGAIVAGFQFPLLVGLLGQGKNEVGEQTGKLYFWNTIGSISGSLAGGFFLIPYLSAPLCWKVAFYLLASLAFIMMMVSIPKKLEMKKLFIVGIFLIIGIIFAAVFRGPTAAWRHTLPDFNIVSQKNKNKLRNWLNTGNKNTIWEKDGKECSVAIRDSNLGLAFIVNGKSDGSSRGDAGTQVMLGLVSAILHPSPHTTLVIGLGTGSSAGWLADVESMKQVDCAEIEPVIETMAEYCIPVNRDVLNNPKVNVIYCDGREVLFSSKKKYDLIVSEPSNPYRPGIATLFTLEFYKAVAARLEKGGIFSQWLQYYNVDQETVRIVYHTLSLVFPYVETWQTKKNDLLLMCSMNPIVYPVKELRKRIRQSTFKSALNDVWRVVDLEGFLAHFVANDQFSRQIANQAKGVINTDDNTIIEYQFADTLGAAMKYNVEGLREVARQLGMSRPKIIIGNIDWSKVGDNRISMFTMHRQNSKNFHITSNDQLHRFRAQYLYSQKEYGEAIKTWEKQKKLPETPYEILVLAHSYAELGDSRAIYFIGKLAKFQPIESGIIKAILLEKQGKISEAVTILESVFVALRNNPWPLPDLVKHALQLVINLERKQSDYAIRLFNALNSPFSTRIMEIKRNEALFFLAQSIDNIHVKKVLDNLEPFVPWNKRVLTVRRNVYKETGNPLLKIAQMELDEFFENDRPGIEAKMIIKK